MLLSGEKRCCVSRAPWCKQKYIFFCRWKHGSKTNQVILQRSGALLQPRGKVRGKKLSTFMIFNALVWYTQIFIHYVPKGLWWERSSLRQSIVPWGEVGATGLPPTWTRLSKLIKTDQIFMGCLRCVGLELIRFYITQHCGRTLSGQVCSRCSRAGMKIIPVVSGVKPLFAHEHRKTWDEV